MAPALKQLLSDPYWQYFCDFEYFQHKLSCDSISLTRWRQQIGEKERSREAVLENVGYSKAGIETNEKKKNNNGLRDFFDDKILPFF